MPMFLYFGRLVQEKGFDLVLGLIQQLLQEKQAGTNDRIDQMKFVVCGEGAYSKEMSELASTHPNITFHGWVDKNRINELLQEAEYTLMPSRFLETFGLTALESLQYGVPVVGIKQGGVRPFILPGLDILAYAGATLDQQLSACIDYCLSRSPEQQISLRQEAKQRAQKYLTEPWLEQFKTQLPQPQTNYKILCISDFATKLGGIETYIHKVQDVLRQEGHHCSIVGLRIAPRRYQRLKKLSLFVTIANIYAAVQIMQAIRKHKPDIIRWHSVTRWIGRLGLFFARNKAKQQWLMYHDLGFFHPFPSRVYSEDQLPKDWSLRSFLAAAQTNNPLLRLIVVLKYLSLSLIRKLLQKYIHQHLVPSAFMLPYLHELYQLDPKKTKERPHFLKVS